MLAPTLLAIPGCGVLTAAKILGETAGVDRFNSKDAFARHNGTAPLPVWSSNQARHRLSRTGNRQLNAALHRKQVGPGGPSTELGHIVGRCPRSLSPADSVDLDATHRGGSSRWGTCAQAPQAPGGVRPASRVPLRQRMSASQGRGTAVRTAAQEIERMYSADGSPWGALPAQRRRGRARSRTPGPGRLCRRAPSGTSQFGCPNSCECGSRQPAPQVQRHGKAAIAHGVLPFRSATGSSTRGLPRVGRLPLSGR